MATSSRRSLGCTLDAVLGAVSTNPSELNPKAPYKKELKHVMVHQLVPGKYQPRRSFDQKLLHELASSIAEQGILQPIVVRKLNAEQYEIIAGERRWRAAQMSGLQQVPVITCEINDESALAFSLIENIQRQDLNPIEEAGALKRLIEEFELTHEQVAKSIGYSRAMVSNMLRLLNLTQPVQKLLVDKKIDAGHAKLLLVFTPEEQEEIATIIVEGKLTVRASEQLVQSRKSKVVAAPKSEIRQHPKCDEWGRVLAKKFSAKVSVKLNEMGAGKITVQVESSAEIERLINGL